jgi:ergothioneine biosynthesis protein EgtB
MATVLQPQSVPDEQRLADRYGSVRALTEALCAPLVTEDYVVQSMDDVSPTKWHLAHTTWFFETFVLRPHAHGYREYDAAYPFLFNSYYLQAGERHCRAQRGYLSRPTVAQVFDYRRHVDAAVAALMQHADSAAQHAIAPLIEIGIHHEQQHQELMLTDIKHVFSVNPLRPAYAAAAAGTTPVDVAPLRWIEHDPGVHEVGHDGAGFAYDNESPRHRVFLEPFALADRLVTAGDYLDFMNDGGYSRPELWLSMGWAAVLENGWTEPFYWERRDDEWWHFTLRGMQRVEPAVPVAHLSYFEADAYARWAGARLPTEFEWEMAAARAPVAGNFVESAALHPAPAAGDAPLRQLFGDVWEWTQSQYSPYPGYSPPAGALGEYNGKFMCNQFVLRGGSCATSVTHIRPTYRNFFPPEATWQFTGLRLARSL